MLEWILGSGAVVFGLALLVVKGKSFFTNKKITEILEQNKANDKQLTKDVEKVDVKEHEADKAEVRVDQQLKDLSKQKIDEADIASFIDALEKQANEKD